MSIRHTDSTNMPSPSCKLKRSNCSTTLMGLFCLTDCYPSDDHGFSPLHWACREGRSGVVDMLIMRGARINVMNRGDDTPLHLAASHGHRDILAKVQNQMHSLVCSLHVNILLYEFVTSAWQLIQCKADPNTANEHGNTPLHYACFWGQDEVAEVHENTPTDPVFCWLKPLSSGEKQPLQLYIAPLITSTAFDI